MERTALTGVTGKLWAMVARCLGAEEGLRYLARQPQRVRNAGAIPVLSCAYENTEQTRRALQGVSVVLMISASESPQRLQQHFVFIDAAKKAGVRHIVYTSFYGAAPTATFTLSRDHWRTEEYLKRSGLAYTIVRDNFYLDFFIDLCRTYGEIKGPAGDGKTSFILRQDVAAVLAAILKEPQRWADQTLELTGEEALSLDEIAKQVGRFLGADIPYIRETEREAYESRKRWPAEPWQYAAWVSTYTAMACGEQSGISDDVRRVLGRAPMTLSQYLVQCKSVNSDGE